MGAYIDISWKTRTFTNIEEFIMPVVKCRFEESSVDAFCIAFTVLDNVKEIIGQSADDGVDANS